MTVCIGADPRRSCEMKSQKLMSCKDGVFSPIYIVSRVLGFCCHDRNRNMGCHPDSVVIGSPTIVPCWRWLSGTATQAGVMG
jgi:hypothetical protein